MSIMVVTTVETIVIAIVVVVVVVIMRRPRRYHTRTSCHGHAHCITDLLCGERPISDRLIPLTKGSNAEFSIFSLLLTLMWRQYNHDHCHRRRLHLTLIVWPNDAIWRHWSGSTLSQVTACCPTSQNHYLNQYWLVISKIHWHSSDGNFTRDTSAINH